jgi:hypothetical protein
VTPFASVIRADIIGFNTIATGGRIRTIEEFRVEVG